MTDRFINWREPIIKDGKLTKWNWMVQHVEELIMGYAVDIGAFTYINAKYGVIIRDNVQIGSHCSIYSESTIDGKKGLVVLKDNCKIGSHTTIMPGVIIGSNSIIGAHSLVTENIPNNVIAFGVPAKVIRRIKNDSR
jgi:acetyltransferase-like isoleucine patch superfamily enzyme